MYNAPKAEVIKLAVAVSTSTDTPAFPGFPGGGGGVGDCA